MKLLNEVEADKGCGCRSRHCLRHGRNGYRSGRLHDGGCRNGRAVDDANVVFAFRDFKFGNAAFAHEVDQCLEFAKVHFVSAMNVSKWAPDVWAAGAGEPHGADGTDLPYWATPLRAYRGHRLLSTLCSLFAMAFRASFYADT